MKYPYKLYPGDFLRPIIPIDIHYQGRHFRYEVLVDSGADINIVPAEIGYALGIDVEDGEEKGLAGITGSGGSYFLHPVSITLGGWSYNTWMGFMPDMPTVGYGVVGHQGFFDLFKKVIFHPGTQEIEIRP